MAQFSVAAVFSNHCVLQRNSNISVFGLGINDSKITVSLEDAKGQLLCKNSSVTENEKWLVQLSPQSAQTDCKMTVECDDNKILFEDIAIGEVWLAGGQSNMEFELQNCTEGPEELKLTEDPKVRFYYTNKIGWMDEHFFEAEKNTCWQTWESQNKTAWSAVGYFYAKKLAADLGVTVGVIGCNWGGTSASAWMQKEYLEKDSELKTYLDEQIEGTKGKSIQQQCDEYDQYEKDNAVWNEKMTELYRKNPSIEWTEVCEILGPCLWPGPRSCKNPYRPTGLYECMLSRIIPYTIKGVIWYQGESDDHKPYMYYKLFSNMIDNWRTSWNNQELPFVYVQLPVNRYKQDKDFKHWCIVRQAQEKIHKTIKNAWMASSMDLGVYNDIHPKSKKVIAERLENIAASKVYELPVKSNPLSPILNSALALENKMILTFDNAENGFKVKDDEETLATYKMLEELHKTPLSEDFTGFEIAGTDGVFYPAKYALSGNDNSLNIIILTSDKVSSPKMARYCWYNYGPVTIYGKNDLPLAPFSVSLLLNSKTETVTEHAAIQQIMTV